MLTLPIVSLQETSKSPKRSLISIFQFLLTTFKSHPSGIKPSKKENSVLEIYGSFLNGIVKEIAFGFFNFKYSSS